MPRFRFRLETLLRVRTSFKKEAQRNLASCQEQLQLRRQEKAVLEVERGEVLQGRSSQPGESLDLARWRDVERYLVVLERRLHKAHQAILEAEEKTEEARERLRSAHRAQLILERLRERRLAQYELEESQRMAKDLDELAVLRHRFRA